MGAHIFAALWFHVQIRSVWVMDILPKPRDILDGYSKKWTKKQFLKRHIIMLCQTIVI